MLERIQLENFVSHEETSLRFDPGVTLFIGRNGSGKSSVIDAITFALYGKHTRGRNKNLVRRGSGDSKVLLTFTMDSKRYQATRMLDAKGSLTHAKLEQIMDSGSTDVLVYGERRQMEEAMSDQASKIIGLDYEKLKVAAVVQQGELDAILKSKPREFKELVNTLIGIEKLDRAFENMGKLVTLFRDRLRERLGYDDRDLENVKEKIADAKKELQDSRKKLDRLKGKLEALSKEAGKIRQRLDVLEPLSGKAKELAEQESEFLEYVRRKAGERREELSNEVERLETLASNALTNLEQASKISEVELRLEPARGDIAKMEEDVQKSDNELGRLQGQLEYANRYLQPVDGKCPVCGAAVKDLKSKLDPKHIEGDLASMKKDAKKKKDRLTELKKEEQRLVKLEALARAAIQFLRSSGIQSSEDVTKIKEDVRKKSEEIARMPHRIESVEEPEEVVIDDYSHALAKKIGKRRKEVLAFDEKEYEEKRMRHEEIVSSERPSLERELGRYAEISERAEKEVETLSEAVEELGSAYAYARVLEKIRDGVFNRDGSVAMSLRSWALKMISQKGSEYISMFNVNVSRIELAEKRRDVVITCYGPRGAIDMNSLSGGEKVAIALALRFAMAYVMGHGRLDFIILDEPTTHLDEERRRSLVRIITEAFREGLGPLLQIVIITHDAEIFENAEVDTIYRFEIGAEGTVITRL